MAKKKREVCYFMGDNGVFELSGDGAIASISSSFSVSGRQLSYGRLYRILASMSGRTEKDEDLDDLVAFCGYAIKRYAELVKDNRALRNELDLPILDYNLFGAG